MNGRQAVRSRPFLIRIRRVYAEKIRSEERNESSL